MSHQQLAETFQKTAVVIQASCLRDLSHEEICRAVYGRLYYALYHKYLEYDTDLANSKDRSRHNEMMRRISANYSIKTFQLYRKMLALRIWADYSSATHAPPGAKEALLGMKTLSFGIYTFIKQKNFQ